MRLINAYCEENPNRLIENTERGGGREGHGEGGAHAEAEPAGDEQEDV
jgi:hypothetical protein